MQFRILAQGPLTQYLPLLSCESVQWSACSLFAALIHLLRVTYIGPGSVKLRRTQHSRAPEDP